LSFIFYFKLIKKKGKTQNEILLKNDLERIPKRFGHTTNKIK